MSEVQPLPWRVLEADFGVGKLRTRAPDAEARLAQALGLPSPAAGRMTRAGDIACIRPGPHEWVVAGGMAGVQGALSALAEAFRDDPALVLDMSHGAITLRLSGARAIERIAAYCDLDLHPDRFRTGHATRTRFGDIAVTLARIDDQPSFWLLADQSYADYLNLLIDHGAPAR